MTTMGGTIDEAFMPCPECGTPAIPASEYRAVFPRGFTPLWCEDDEADCPGCGVHLRAHLTGDGEDEWMEALVVEGGDHV